ncbi:MAG: hypothetical protein O8C67_17410 [Candidatus Methanoperedens sp.]|nr:hypothetical protein [Candidatus Methanoperedens sp.]
MVKHNDTGGGMTVKEAVITSVKVAALIGALYVLGYFVFVAFHFTVNVTIGKFLVRTLHLYPNSFIEDLNPGDTLNMSRTVLILCAIFIPVALYMLCSMIGLFSY